LDITKIRGADLWKMMGHHVDVECTSITIASSFIARLLFLDALFRFVPSLSLLKFSVCILYATLSGTCPYGISCLHGLVVITIVVVVVIFANVIVVVQQHWQQ
jgi:hypothetical protein